jgi:DDE superfamily endonuclease
VPENTTTSTPLLDALRTLILAHRSAFRQERTLLRAQALILGHLFCFARRTITQALIALSLTDHDWSAFYRLFAHKRIDYELLSSCFFKQTLPHVPLSAPYVAVVDGVQIPRSSHTMPGTSWLRSPKTPPFRPAPHRAQRFLHLAALLPRSQEGYTRALPLPMEPSFPEKAVPAEGFAPRKQWEAALEATLWLRANLDAAARQEQRLLMLGDGDFSVAELRANLPEEGVILMSGCAKNRALYELPEVCTKEEGSKKRGRRRKYGQRARRPEEWLAKRGGWHQAHLTIRGREVRSRYRVEGPFVIKKASDRPVFLVVVKGVRRGCATSPRHHRWRKAAYWLVSAVLDHSSAQWRLPYPAEELLSWAWQRWEVEVCHREMKSGFGLGEAQCWGEYSAILSVRWRAFSYGVLVLAGFRAWGPGRGPIRPPGRWWGGSGRWSLGTLWRGYRSEMWGSYEFRPIFAPIRGGWPKKEALLAAQGNAVSGSLRG